MADFDALRHRMVDVQLRQRGIRDEAVLRAMSEVPREAFVPDALHEYAYRDGPLPIAAGQTISQPFVVAVMIELAEIGEADNVLEIGAGSGYAAAVMSRIAKRVMAIERHDELTQSARVRLAKLGYANVEVITGDGSRGYAESAPFDAIVVSAGGPTVPHPLLEQLEIGGVLVMPVGEPGAQRLWKITRRSAVQFEELDVGAVSFVPMVGEHGWPSD